MPPKQRTKKQDKPSGKSGKGKASKGKAASQVQRQGVTVLVNSMNRRTGGRTASVQPVNQLGKVPITYSIPLPHIQPSDYLGQQIRDIHMHLLRQPPAHASAAANAQPTMVTNPMFDTTPVQRSAGAARVANMGGEESLSPPTLTPRSNPLGIEWAGHDSPPRSSYSLLSRDNPHRVAREAQTTAMGTQATQAAPNTRVKRIQTKPATMVKGTQTLEQIEHAHNIQHPWHPEKNVTKGGVQLFKLPKVWVNNDPEYSQLNKTMRQQIAQQMLGQAR